MTAPVLSPAVRAALQPRTPVDGPSARSVRFRVGLAWCLLFLNVLTYYAGMETVVPLPGAAGKLVTQAALVGALIVALSVNRPVVFRPSLFLALFTLLAVQALVTSAHAEFVLGSVFRAGRLAGFVLVLWLLTPWWGRRDMLLVRAHLTALSLVLASILLGVLIAPGLALADGRLTGVVWPIPPTQVGHYAAVTLGMVGVLWLSGLVQRGPALVVSAVALPMLLMSHTRTALAAALVASAVAGLSMFNLRARVRRVFGLAVLGCAIAALTVSSTVTTWLSRGQTSADLANLTGRRDVWDAIVELPRSTSATLFGSGLSNKSFDGLPIDSNWLATYYDLGVVGVALNVAAVLALLVAALFRPSSPARALALFLVTYCCVASFTETGLSDASPYVLELALAASLLALPRGGPGS